MRNKEKEQHGIQMTLSEVTPEYERFVEKFKPKKTTDDCYTPQNIYDEVLNWCRAEYGIPDNAQIIRPFWPGGDYERHEYPVGCYVIDNPPFSIISAVTQFYEDAGINYFLFAPYLTNFNNRRTTCHIITGSGITYENGAKVDTSFVTNLDHALVRSVPELGRRIAAIDKANAKEKAKTLPRYEYPAYVLTASMVGYMAKHGVEYRLDRKDAVRIRQLDSQRDAGKTIFGGGFLLSEKAAAEKAAAEKAAAEKAAAEKAAAEKWKLSKGEWMVVKSLGR